MGKYIDMDNYNIVLRANGIGYVTIFQNNGRVQLNNRTAIIVRSRHLLIKYGVIKFCGFIFKLQDKATTFINTYFVLISLLGILCFPISIGIIYGTEIVQKISIILFVLSGIIVFNMVCIKLFQIFFRGIGSIFYIFLYLCAMEILPVFILLKIAFMG